MDALSVPYFSKLLTKDPRCDSASAEDSPLVVISANKLAVTSVALPEWVLELANVAALACLVIDFWRRAWCELRMFVSASSWSVGPGAGTGAEAGAESTLGMGLGALV